MLSDLDQLRTQNIHIFQSKMSFVINIDIDSITDAMKSRCFIIFNVNKIKGITTIEAKDNNIISVGTNGGKIFILNIIDGDADSENIGMETVHEFIAHPPVQSDDAEYKEQFGSIHRAADIWSSHWSPDGRYLATASEDQSVRIWDIENGCKRNEILIGHTAAVTAVDWTVLCNPKIEVLASCSDDNAVMIWNPRRDKEGIAGWELMHKVVPKAIMGWFTLTYR